MAFRMIYLARKTPDVSMEDWPDTWRSHASYCKETLGLGGGMDRILYCARTAQSPAGYSTGYDGVGMVFAESVEAVTANVAPEMFALVETDERRVFGAPATEFSFVTEKAFGLGEVPGRSAVIRFLARPEGVSREAFAARLADGHASIARGMAGSGSAITAHVHDVLTQDPPPGYPFDAITQTWFAGPDEALAAASDGTLAPLEEDYRAFCDTGRSVSLVTRLILDWPKAPCERQIYG